MIYKLPNNKKSGLLFSKFHQLVRLGASEFRNVLIFPAFVAACFLVPHSSFAESALQNTLRISAAKSSVDSGVLKVLTEDFSRRNSEINVQLTDVGALEALRHGRSGLADLVITHHPLDEERFVDQGYGRDRTQFLYSEYVMFGPADQYPELSKAKDIISALKILAAKEAEFLVPSARSGTYRKIEELWATAGIDTNWVDYENTGSSGSSTLRQAADRGAYTIVDMGTYLTSREKIGGDITPLYRGDFALRNIYSVLIVRSEKITGANEQLAQKFYDYLIGEEGQEVIRKYGEEVLNISYLTPAANFDASLREKRAQESARHYKKQSEKMRSLFVIASIFLVMTILLFVGIRRAEKKRHDVEIKAQNLEIDRDSAQHANDIKSLFLANMSHEIRTPLNAIIGYSQLMEEEIAEVGDFEFTKDLKCIDRAAHHLLTLINDVLDLSKIEAGMMDINSHRVDVRDLVERICATLQPIAHENGNKLICKIKPDVDELFIDEIRLTQILMNLLSNACKFTKDGRVTIMVRHEYNDLQNSCIFEVSDTGVGIAQESQGKIFDAFIQADSTTTREYGGTGLGLAISKRFCELMNGEIFLKSDINKGSTFTVRFPFNVEALKAAS